MIVRVVGLPPPAGVKVITYLATERTFGKSGGSINTVSTPLRTAIAVSSATAAGTGGRSFTSAPRRGGTTRDGTVVVGTVAGTVAGTVTGTVTTGGRIVVVVAGAGSSVIEVGGVEFVS